jgi:hypothetical protein
MGWSGGDMGQIILGAAQPGSAPAAGGAGAGPECAEGAEAEGTWDWRKRNCRRVDGGRGRRANGPAARAQWVASPPRKPAAAAPSPPAPPRARSGALLERVESRAYSERYIAGLVRSILRFIAQCHARGIVYRDVKPGRVWGLGFWGSRVKVSAVGRVGVHVEGLHAWLSCAPPPSAPSKPQTASTTPPGPPDNFLFLTKAEDSPLKATDFGLSIRHGPEEPKLTSRSGARVCICVCVCV